MAVEIHPQAIVEKGALLDDNVKIGPFAIVESTVKIGKDTTIETGANILGHTEIGKNCLIHPYAVLGGTPQDLKYKGEKSFLFIGDKNVIREFVTINTGTEAGSKTVVGEGNLIMAYSHIAHNCFIGNNNIMANVATLAGHVELGNKVVIGGMTAIHQFCRIGDFSIIGGCSKVVQDVPPFSLTDGHPARVQSINIVGLKRAEISKETILDIKRAFKILFFSNHPFDYAKEIVKKELPDSEEIKYLVDFISSSKRGIRRR